MTWNYPSVWFLLLLLLVPVVGYLVRRNRRNVGVKFSSTRVAGSLRTTLKMHLRWLPPVLRIVAVVLLIIALARPQKGNEKTLIFSEGIAIEMLVDRSGSMRAMDFKLHGKNVDRLEAIKDVATKFISGDKTDRLKGRPHDMVGMITFARFSDTASPLTLDHRYLTDKLNKTQIVTERSEDGTAIGDAIGLGVERLESLKRRAEKDGHTSVKSKVIILLTDGENNAGDMKPAQAAELAKSLDVKIYTIGVGTRGQAPFVVDGPFGGKRTVWQRVTIDEKTLKQIAKTTGGKYFRATNTDSLRDIYAQIDKLEKTKIDEQRYADYRQLALKPIHLSGFTFPPLLLIGFVLLGVEVLLSNTYLRKIP